MIISGVLAGVCASIRWTWWKKKKQGLPVLVYHKIGYAPRNSKLKELWVSPEKFTKHIKYLIKHNYSTILFSDLLKDYQGVKPLPANPVMITFDDGYENNYTYAFKILQELGAKANIFLVFNTIGKVNLWHDTSLEPWINMLTWEMIEEMQKSGLIEFGSHTMNHPNLKKIPLDDAEWEIRESKNQFEAKLTTKIYAFAYPYGVGAYNLEIRQKVLDAGYLFDFSFKQGKTHLPWQREKEPIDRLFIKGNENIFDFYLHLTRGVSRLM